jgi:hypothetical protein
MRSERRSIVQGSSGDRNGRWLAIERVIAHDGVRCTRTHVMRGLRASALEAEKQSDDDR